MKIEQIYSTNNMPGNSVTYGRLQKECSPALSPLNIFDQDYLE